MASIKGLDTAKDCPKWLELFTGEHPKPGSSMIEKMVAEFEGRKEKESKILISGGVNIDVEDLARILHDSEQVVVDAYNKIMVERFGVGAAHVFRQWGEVEEWSRDTKRTQARYLLDRLDMKRRDDNG